ncbi:MAG: intradiol ring-cleavage dioxygenase [Fulvivirga sp.]|nr:intradiol ring-cleavage dioxygenase [Fulvivirga sp.]
MKIIYFLIFTLFVACNTSGQHTEKITKKEAQLVGGPCEGCEAVFEYKDRSMNHIDTLPDFFNEGPKLKVSGIIYQPDGKTPAPGVIMYVHHTNQNGIYPKKGDEKGWGKRHGYIRGWIKTNEKGQYEFYTLIPGAYPDGNNPQHIHPVILEPDGKYYYIEDFLFEDDPLLTHKRKTRQEKRGGEGNVLSLKKEEKLHIAHRDIVLGKNVAGYE